MKLLFLGSGDFAVPCLSRLITAGHDLVSVVTQPDRPAGRGGTLRQTPVKELALESGFPVFQPESLRDDGVIETFIEYRAELAVVVAYGQLIPADILETTRNGFVNLHASLLPKYRGAAPVPHAILNDERETGVTVFRLNERFDEGDILKQSSIPILPNDTSATVLGKLAPVGAELMNETVSELVANTISPMPQKDEEASKAPKMRKDDGRIDWTLPGRRIDCMIRAYQPWPLAFTIRTKGKKASRIVILQVSQVQTDSSSAPGTVLTADPKEGLVVKCGDAALKLVTVKPEGKREMTAVEYLRGARIEPGEFLG